MINLKEQGKTPNARPDFLTILCILTFIGSGLASFSNLFLFLSFDDILPIMEEQEFQFPGIELILSGGKQFFLTGFILYTISLAGTVRMWRLKKIGFHLYTGAQIFILIMPFAFIDAYQFSESVFSLLITVIFVLGYAGNLKFMS